MELPLSSGNSDGKRKQIKMPGFSNPGIFIYTFHLFKKASLKLNLKVQISKNKQITIPQIFNYQTVYEIDFLNLFEI
jgi:hypothetical protein